MCGALVVSSLSTTWASPCFRYSSTLLVPINPWCHLWALTLFDTVCHSGISSNWFCNPVSSNPDYLLNQSLLFFSFLLLCPDGYLTPSSRLMTTGSIWPWWRESWDQCPLGWFVRRGEKEQAQTPKWSIFCNQINIYIFEHNSHWCLCPLRKQKYFYRGRLDWDESSSAGKYVRENCKPLRVRRVDAKWKRNEFISSRAKKLKAMLCIKRSVFVLYWSYLFLNSVLNFVVVFPFSILFFTASGTCCQRQRSTTSCLTSLKACWSTSPLRGWCWPTPSNTLSSRMEGLVRQQAARTGRATEISVGDPRTCKDWMTED